MEGDRSRTAAIAIFWLSLVLVAVGIISLGVGASGLSLRDVATTLLAGPEATDLPAGDVVIVWQIRMPRMLLGMLIGASLAVAGTVLQGLFRNPLADPALVGVSSGAALGAVTVVVLGPGILVPVLAVTGLLALPLAAFIGGLAATVALYMIATRRGRTSVSTMLLAGIALAALAAAATGLLIYVATEQQTREIAFWSLGALSGASWSKLVVAGPIMALVLIAAPFFGRGLNAIVLGEAEAFHLGIDVQLLKRLAVFLVAAATGTAVAVSGVIGFVGIVVPHLVRLLVGADHRVVLPASALFGASFLIACDLVARALFAPTELPVGIVTALIGGPFFLWLLFRHA